MIAAWTLGPANVLGLSAAGVLLGGWMTRRLPLLDRLSVPPAITGGFLFAATVWVLHERWLNFTVDTTLRDLFMLVVFTIIGLNASLSLLRRGGVQVLTLLGLATLGAVLQNALGMAVARAVGLNPLVGVAAGAVSLAGGPATSIAFGASLERAGLGGATAIALASATFGIAVSGFLAGAAGAWLMRGRTLRLSAAAMPGEHLETSGGSALVHIAAIAISIGFGAVVSDAIERTGVVLPRYIGAMAVAAVIRNVGDRFGSPRLSEQTLVGIFRIALPLFIVMAMLSIRLWALAAIAGGLLLVLLAQVVLTVSLALGPVFWAMGRDREAAVMAGGFTGFMLGITANAMASMGELERRFGPAPRAFLVVPVVGAFLIDFTNSIVITVTLKLVSP